MFDLREKKAKKGFTLIEILIVIAILAILAMIILSSLRIAQSRTYDARRLAEMRNFSVALETYYDKYGVYPCGVIGTHNGARQTDRSSYHTGVYPDTFLNSKNTLGTFVCNGGPDYGVVTESLLPSGIMDPRGGTYDYFYDVMANRQMYILYTRLETDPDRMANDGGLNDCVYELGPGVGIMAPFWGFSC